MLATEEYGIISLFGAWQNILTIFATLNLSNQIFNNGMVKYEKDQDGYSPKEFRLVPAIAVSGCAVPAD